MSQCCQAPQICSLTSLQGCPRHIPAWNSLRKTPRPRTPVELPQRWTYSKVRMTRIPRVLFASNAVPRARQEPSLLPAWNPPHLKSSYIAKWTAKRNGFCWKTSPPILQTYRNQDAILRHQISSSIRNQLPSQCRILRSYFLSDDGRPGTPSMKIRHKMWIRPVKLVGALACLHIGAYSVCLYLL